MEKEKQDAQTFDFGSDDSSQTESDELSGINLLVAELVKEYIGLFLEKHKDIIFEAIVNKYGLTEIKTASKKRKLQQTQK